MHSSFNDSALNLSKCSSNLNMSGGGDDYYYNVKSELDLSNQNTNPNAVVQQHQQQLAAALGASFNPAPAHQHQHTSSHASNNNNATQQQQQHSGNQLQQHQQLLHNDSRVSSTRNDSSTGQNNTYDDLDNSSVRSGDEGAALSNQGSDEVEELEAIDADFPYPLILNSHHSPTTSGAGINGSSGGVPPLKRRRKHLNSTGEEDNDADDDDDQDQDEYDGQMLQQHRHLRAQNMANGLTHNGLMGDIMAQPQTVREVLNSKFCGFISAKLNSMEDSEADNLMNKILMLLVQTQMNNAMPSTATAGTTGSSSPSGSSLNVSTPMGGSEAK